MSSRRTFLQRTAALGAGVLATGRTANASNNDRNASQGAAHGGYQGNSSGSLSKLDRHHGAVETARVITTEVGDLSYEMDGDIKVFRLTAHVFKQQIAPNKTIDVWGFNGSSPGPTIQVRQGDQLRVIFRNELPEPSSLHWHGFEDQIGFDGMPGISQEPVKPGESFTYNFKIKQEGTYFYHSHMAMQEMAGMLGAVIMHPKTPYRPHCDKDFVIHLQEYWVLANATTPNTMNMEFNWLVLNGKSGPASTPLIVRQGDRVRIRFVNLGMDHHPMHLHGHTFYTTGTEGGRIPESAWWPGNTVLVGVAQARDVEFIADNPGDWMLHCHLPHHMMNQMSSQVGPMTRAAGYPGGRGMRGDDSHGRPLPPMQQMDQMQDMGMKDMPGMQMDKPKPNPSPTELLATGVQASSPDSSLANTQMDAGMMGMMKQHQTGQPQMSELQHRNMSAFDMSAGGMKAQQSETSPNANDVPNFPQDAYMEGPMMNMETLVQKPENMGLRPNWSRFMQGMMTFVRVLPPDQYDQVIAAMKNAKRPNDPYATLYASSAQHSTI